MGDKHGTKIEWTHVPGYKGETWNPVIGCARVSAGCRNCWAEKMARRLVEMSGHNGTGGGPYAEVVKWDGRSPVGSADEAGAEYGTPLPLWNGNALFLPERLDQPLRWRKPRCIFVPSMGDLFHRDITNEQIAAVFGVMAACPQHIFIIATKRARGMRGWFDWLRVLRAQALGDAEVRICIGAADRYGLRRGHVDYPPWPLPNVWLGVSVENQPTADERIPLLLQCPAAVRWVSYEPALGPVDWRNIVDSEGGRYDSLTGGMSGSEDQGGPALDWIVCGGESGPGARPFDVNWARATIEQCRETATACFIKQLGAHPVRSQPGAGPGAYGVVLRHRKGADPDEWPAGLRVRQYPT